MMRYHNPLYPMSWNMWSSMTSPEVHGGQIVPLMLLGQWSSLNMSVGIINQTTLQLFERQHWYLLRTAIGEDGITLKSISEWSFIIALNFSNSDADDSHLSLNNRHCLYAPIVTIGGESGGRPPGSCIRNISPTVQDLLQRKIRAWKILPWIWNQIICTSWVSISGWTFRFSSIHWWVRDCSALECS